jgi:hypothetical protein
MIIIIMYLRSLQSNIILTIFPHLFSLFYTFDNFFYSFIISVSTITSILWHRQREPNNILLYLDYGSASILSFYEIYNTYYINDKLFTIALCANIYVLIFNKIVYYLSKELVIKYSLWHSFYHILSALKTTFIAFLSYN